MGNTPGTPNTAPRSAEGSANHPNTDDWLRKIVDTSPRRFRCRSIFFKTEMDQA